MLHTLNKAWANILIKQAETDPQKKMAFACTDEELDKWRNFLKDSGTKAKIRVLPLWLLKIRLKYEQETKSGKIYHRRLLGDFDDILISHDIHDIMIKDFLCRHCKRKGS